MPLYVVTVDHTMYGSRGSVKVDPVCGVFETLEKAQEAINYLVKKNSYLIHEDFDIDEVELDKTYYDF
jgi:hypothetical protein